MKTIALFISGLVAFAAIIIGGGYLLLRGVNEVRRKTCGKCDFYDPALQHCWLRGITAGTEDPACITFEKREK